MAGSKSVGGAKSIDNELLTMSIEELMKIEVRYADFQGVRSFIKWRDEMEDEDGITAHPI